jgi:DNA-binding NtrC family response regulator
MAHACGDKFLIVGRCVSYQRTHTAEHPGHVLILWSADSKAAAAIRDVQLQDVLQQAGHRVNIVEESESTPEAIKSGAYDIVLVDAADADRIRLGLVGTPTRVLPVMYQATNAEVDQVRQNYRCALNVRRAPIKRSQLLVALDDAMRRK